MKVLAPIFLAFSAWLVFSGQTASAQSPPDTLLPKQRTLREVVVFGTPLPRYATGSRITVIDSSVLAQYNSWALSEILQIQLPLYFRNYGQNQLNSVGFRGTSANHTAVLWNGFTINSPTFGSSDFSILPAFGFSQVAIQHGNSAATWGSGAIGGSVLVGSHPVFGKGYQVNLQTETSRFGMGDFSLKPLRFNYLSNQAGIRYSNRNFHFSTNIWQNQAENNFPYRNIVAFGSPEVRQQNAVFRQWGITQDLDWKFAKNGLLSAKIWYTHTHRQAQPSMLEANQGNYRVDDSFRVLLSGNYVTRWGETTLKTAFFRDALNWNGANSPVYSSQTQLLHEKVFSEKISLKTGAEFQVFHADIASNYNRRETRQSAFVLSSFRPWERLTLTLNLRQMWVTGFDPPFTPHLGASFIVYKIGNQEIILKANAGRSYRVPTLHDRFWVGGGNPGIRPETSFGYEGGLTHRVSIGKWRVVSEMTYYRNQIQDWIEWVPPRDTLKDWSPQNALLVKTQGLEFSNHVSYAHEQTKISLKTQYFLTRAVYGKSENTDDIGKQLPFTPLHNFLIFSEITRKQWFGFVNHAFTGTRENFGYNSRMESYGLSSAMLGRTIKLQKIQLQILFKCNNLFNVQYRTYGYYAMPGRIYSLSVRFVTN